MLMPRPKQASPARHRVNRCAGRSGSSRSSTLRPYRRRRHTLLVLMAPCCSPVVATPAAAPATRCAIAAGSRWHRPARQCVASGIAAVFALRGCRQRPRRCAEVPHRRAAAGGARRPDGAPSAGSATSTSSPGRRPVLAGCAGAATTRPSCRRDIARHSACRAGGCSTAAHDAPQTGVARRAPGRAVVPGPASTARPAGARRRRRRHHRRHPPCRGRGAAGCRRRPGRTGRGRTPAAPIAHETAAVVVNWADPRARIACRASGPVHTTTTAAAQGQRRPPPVGSNPHGHPRSHPPRR